MVETKRCPRCCISEHFPGIVFDAQGICSECHKFEDAGGHEALMQSNREEMERIIAERRGKSKYDVIVAYSGGKDSSYTLLHLRKAYDLKVLAYLVDNNFVADQAKINASEFTGRLGVDLLTFKPNAQFMNKMYTKSLEGDLYNVSQLSRANAACLSCINLINNFVLDEAVRRQIPIIAGGYIEGQVPAHTGVVNMDNKMISTFRDKNRKFLSEKIDPRFDQYLNIAQPPANEKHPIFINPLLGQTYSEKDIIEAITPYGWTRPTDTGKSSSNCLLNDYAIAVHFEKYRFHPYEAEICAQVRRNTLSREEAIDKLTSIYPPDHFKETQKRLANQ
jgi:hypothetical protein